MKKLEIYKSSNRKRAGFGQIISVFVIAIILSFYAVIDFSSLANKKLLLSRNISSVDFINIKDSCEKFLLKDISAGDLSSKKYEILKTQKSIIIGKNIQYQCAYSFKDSESDSLDTLYMFDVEIQNDFFREKYEQKVLWNGKSFEIL